LPSELEFQIREDQLCRVVKPEKLERQRIAAVMRIWR
jgi:hypothetical protein